MSEGLALPQGCVIIDGHSGYIYLTRVTWTLTFANSCVCVLVLFTVEPRAQHTSKHGTRLSCASVAVSYLIVAYECVNSIRSVKCI